MQDDPFELDEHRVVELAKRVGADPSQRVRMQDVRSSFPLLPEIQGTKGYRTRLSRAAETLYRMIHANDHVTANFGKSVFLRGKDHGVLPTLPKRPKPAHLFALEILLHSLANLASWPTKMEGGKIQRRDYVAVPLDNNQFTKGAYEQLSGKAFGTMVYALTIFTDETSPHPWLEYRSPQFNQNTGERRQTRVRADIPFCNWMTTQGLIFANHPFARSTRKKSRDALLRVSITDPETGKKTTIPLDRPLENEELILPLINDALAAQTLSRPLNTYKEFTDNFDFERGMSKNTMGGRKRLYRQFAGADGRGGRLYGHWVQNLPGWLRRGLLIKGKPAVELDFGNMQLALLYALSEVPVPNVKDLYAMPGMPRDRDGMKMVLTLTVGNATKGETLASIRKRLHDEGRAGPDKAERLYDTFWACHEAVNPHRDEAPDGAWAELQNLDSRIALRILAKLLDHGITAIPVHDSFIVERVYLETTRDIMLEVFAKYCPTTNVSVRVTDENA